MPGWHRSHMMFTHNLQIGLVFRGQKSRMIKELIKEHEDWKFGSKYKKSLAGWLEYLVLSGILFKKTWCEKPQWVNTQDCMKEASVFFSLWCSTGSLSLEMPNQYFWLFCGLEKPVSVINVPEDVPLMPSWGWTLDVQLFRQALNSSKKIWMWPKLWISCE